MQPEMQPQKAILVRYGEVWLKTPHVRRRFEQILIGNIRSLFRDKVRIFSAPGRIFVYAPKIPEGLSRVFGITSFSPAFVLEKDIEKARALARQLAKKWKKGSTFAIRASRTDKSFPMSSREIEIAVANEIPPHFKVDLSSPDNRIAIEVRDRMYVCEKEIEGPGGLPLGSGGMAAAMLRDERDLAAAWLMMKRGVSLVFIKPKKALLEKLERWIIGRKARSAKSLEDVQKKIKAVVDVREEKPLAGRMIVLNPLAGWSGREVRDLLKKISAR